MYESNSADTTEARRIFRAGVQRALLTHPNINNTSQLSEQTGIPYSTLRSWILQTSDYDSREPSLTGLVQIATALTNGSVDELIKPDV